MVAVAGATLALLALVLAGLVGRIIASRRIGHHRAFGQFDFQLGRCQLVAGKQVGDLGGKTMVEKLAGQDIDRHRNLETFAPFPFRHLAAGLLDHPIANADDQTGFLRRSGWHDHATEQHVTDRHIHLAAVEVDVLPPHIWIQAVVDRPPWI